MTTVKAPQAIDLTAQSTWQVQLGASVTRRERRNGFTTRQYNYYPKSATSNNVERRFSSVSSAGATSAQIRVNDLDYSYSGSSGVAHDQYVLILESSAHSKARLERLSTRQVFNVTRTPTQSDEQFLRKRLPQLDLHVDREHSEGEEDGITAPRPDNPYDYRHLLDLETTDDVPVPSHPTSTVNTPQARPARPAAKHNMRSKQSNNPSLPNDGKTSVEGTASKRRKTSHNRNASPMPSASAKQRTPAQARDIDQLDSGELIIEDDTGPGASRADAHGKQQSSMSLALAGQLGHHGPMSLHSAASSPRSPFRSPALRDTVEAGDNAIELGDVSDGQDAGDEQEDADIDDEFELPSPARDRSQTTKLLPEIAVTDEDEDDLSKELAKAMAEQDEEPLKQQIEEESEEE